MRAGPAHRQHRREPGVCRRAGVEPERHVQPLPVRHARDSLHAGHGERQDHSGPGREPDARPVRGSYATLRWWPLTWGVAQRVTLRGLLARQAMLALAIPLPGNDLVGA